VVRHRADPKALRDTVASVILVVAATARELEGARGADTLVCGIGPVEAALATARAIEERRPRAILHVGIAGAQTLEPPALVLGTESVYCDIVDERSVIPRVARVEPDGALLDLVGRALPGARRLPIATSAVVGGGTSCEVEAMEGFGVLRAAALASVPAVELRAVSNAVAERDRARWQFEAAFAALGEAIPHALAAIV
jgi:futalosine hydrolase